MKKTLVFLIVPILAFCGVNTSGWHWVIITNGIIPPDIINEITLMGSPHPHFLVDPLNDRSILIILQGDITYKVFSNDGNVKKVTGRLDNELPSGARLLVELGAVEGSKSHGIVGLTTSDKTLVSSIPPNPDNKVGSLTYGLDVSGYVSASQVFTRRVIYTLLDN